MVYTDIANIKVDSVIDILKNIKNTALNKRVILLEKNHSSKLLDIVKLEEGLFVDFLTALKDLNSFIDITPYSTLKNLVDDCNNDTLLKKYNYLLDLEEEVKEINDLNFEIVSECLRLNSHYLNLLYPKENVGYSLDNKTINKKLQLLQTY